MSLCTNRGEGDLWNRVYLASDVMANNQVLSYSQADGVMAVLTDAAE